MNSIFLNANEMPAEWLAEIKNSLGEDIVFSPRGYFRDGEAIPYTLYSMSTDEYLDYLRELLKTNRYNQASLTRWLF